MSINGHKTSCTRTMYLINKKKKRYMISSLHPSKNNNNTLPNKVILKTNSPPKSDYSHIQNYSPFLSRMTKGRVSSRHLIDRASISIIIWSIIVITIIIITEPNSRRRRIGGWRSTKTKRVPGWSGFTLKCHRHV